MSAHAYTMDAMDAMDDEAVTPPTSLERTTTDDLCSRPYGTFVGDATNAGSFQNDGGSGDAPVTPEAQQHANVFGDVDNGEETTTTIITTSATRRGAAQIATNRLPHTFVCNKHAQLCLPTTLPPTLPLIAPSLIFVRDALSIQSNPIQFNPIQSSLCGKPALRPRHPPVRAATRPEIS